jgi:hypothetical protein
MCRATAATRSHRQRPTQPQTPKSNNKELPLTSPYVEPVWIIRTLFLVGSRLDKIDPIRDLELSRTLEV